MHPALALLAGILMLVMPWLPNCIMGIYLVIKGIVGELDDKLNMQPSEL